MQPDVHRESLTPVPEPPAGAGRDGPTAWYASPVVRALLVTVIVLGNPWVNKVLVETVADFDIGDDVLLGIPGALVWLGVRLLQWVGWDLEGQFDPGGSVLRLLIFVPLAGWLAHRVQSALSSVGDRAAKGLRLARMFAMSGACVAGAIGAVVGVSVAGLLSGGSGSIPLARLYDAMGVGWLLGFLIAGWATRPGQGRRAAGSGDLF